VSLIVDGAANVTGLSRLTFNKILFYWVKEINGGY